MILKYIIDNRSVKLSLCSLLIYSSIIMIPVFLNLYPHIRFIYVQISLLSGFLLFLLMLISEQRLRKFGLALLLVFTISFQVSYYFRELNTSFLSQDEKVEYPETIMLIIKKEFEQLFENNNVADFTLSTYYALLQGAYKDEASIIYFKEKLKSIDLP